MIRLLATAIVLAVLSACAAEQPAPGKTSHRIISLAPHLTELVYTAGAGQFLVGVVAYSDFPAQALKLPLVGDAFRIDPEVMAVLQPTLVLAWRSGNPKELLDQLAERGYRVVALPSATLEDVAANLREIGALVGTEPVAEAAAQQYLSKLAALRLRHSGNATLRTFYQISAQPLYTVGKPHPVTQIIELCGGRNIFDDLSDVAPVVSIEDVLLREPAVMIAGSARGSDEFSQWRKWTQLPAVAGHNLYTVDPSLVNRGSTRILAGVDQVCRYLEQARAGAESSG